MKTLLALLLLAQSAVALEPGQQTTVTLPDGTVINGVVVTTGTSAASQSYSPAAPTPQAQQPPPQALPPMGFGAPQPGQPVPSTLTGTYVGVPVIPVQPFSPQEQRHFLKQQAAEREARKHQATTPTSDWQFDLQQALDRQAHGLPFSPK